MTGVERRTPKAGDVVIRREAGNPGHRYSISEFPGAPQLSYMSFEIALDVATGFARSAGVTVWYEEEGQCGLIESRNAVGTT